MDMPDEFYSDWHCFKRGSDQLDQTQAWRLTNPLFRFLNNSGLVFDTIRINSDTNVEQLLEHGNGKRVAPGDVIFFTEERGGESYYHVGLISSVTDGFQIGYAANTDDVFDKPLSVFFKEKPESEVVILCMTGPG